MGYTILDFRFKIGEVEMSDCILDLRYKNGEWLIY